MTSNLRAIEFSRGLDRSEVQFAMDRIAEDHGFVPAPGVNYKDVEAVTGRTLTLKEWNALCKIMKDAASKALAEALAFGISPE